MGSPNERKKKGGDDLTGHHLPGWGGVLLGKTKLKPDNSLPCVMKFRSSGPKDPYTRDQISHSMIRVNTEMLGSESRRRPTLFHFGAEGVTAA